MLCACIHLYFTAQDGFSLFYVRSQECETRAFLLCDLLFLTLQLEKFIGLSCLCSTLQYLISRLISCQTRLIRAVSSQLPVPHPSFSSLLLHQFLLSVGGDLTSPLEDWFIFTYIEFHCAMFSTYFENWCLTYCFSFFSGAQIISLFSSGDVTFSHEPPFSRVLSRPVLGGAGLRGQRIARYYWSGRRTDLTAVLRRGQQYIQLQLPSPASQARPSSLYSTRWCADTSQPGHSTFPRAPDNST